MGVPAHKREGLVKGVEVYHKQKLQIKYHSTAIRESTAAHTPLQAIRRVAFMRVRGQVKKTSDFWSCDYVVFVRT